ncbi:SPARC-related modular calcium-binding protein 1-like isoform X1 [Thamnophis elegans]|uniref:SPARC-related modular calcium-binding protein 1-like isoform X1 n=1 Tax=Thamnophis elegans TaxID=35005 RepID=UPI001377BCDE|nr:SPARC-related modular calcium-binding protein 1-like isoform X1 [Thamnophis elegans]
MPPALWLLVFLLQLTASFRSPFLISEGGQERLPCPAECPPHEHGRPLCASDGKFYLSPCAFQEARCERPNLQVWPRFRCRGAAQQDNNSANLTRCQEDRAAALAKSRRQSHALYVPECSENGAFLEVQCHKQTGYCWCSTPEGKPIAGTSALNQAPNCTGMDSAGTSWQDAHSSKRDDIKPSVIAAFHLFSSLNAEEGVAPQPTQPSPVPRRQPEGTTLPFLIPIILPDFKTNHTAKPAQEYPPSCEQERREAIHEARQHQQEGTFIPECEGDGTYKEVQCHQATGYCWCVRVVSGRPIPGTSTRNFPPDCEADTATKSTEIRSLFRDRILPGCPGSKKTQFLTQLIKALSSHMLQSRLMTIPYRRFPDSLAAPSLEDRAVRWQFTHLDRDFSNGVSERELRPFKLYMKQNARPKRCVRKFLDYCDLSGNRLISLPEFRGCLGLS